MSDEPTQQQRLMHGELEFLIEEALSQLDHGVAVDVEDQTWDFVRRWTTDPPVADSGEGTE